VVRYERMVVKYERMGFMPRAIRLVRFNWQHSSSGAISYLWVLSLIVASWSAHTQFTFQKYPFFRPSSIPSVTSNVE